MRFIVNNKLYDTDKAELLCTFSKQWESKTILDTLYPYRDTNLYKTAKGAYFFHLSRGLRYSLYRSNRREYG